MTMISHLFMIFYLFAIFLVFIFLLHVRFHIHSEHRDIQLQSLLDVLQHSDCVFDSKDIVYKMDSHSLYKNIDLLDETDKELLCGILCILAQNIPNLIYFETILLKGAHIIVSQDHGLFYEWFKSQKESYTRISSHKSIVPVYSIPVLKNKNSIISGIYPMNDSWFQFEADMWKPLERPRQSFYHAYNYIYYKLVNYQVGPFGTCSYTDHNPFITSIDTDQFPTIFRHKNSDL